MKKILLLCCTAALLFSCKKKEERITLRTEIITEGQWKITASVTELRVNGQTTTTDLYALMPDCVKDNLYKFNMDGSVTTDEGDTKCDPNAPQTFVNPGGKWEFTDADTKIRITDTSMAVLSTIVSLDNTGMVLKYETNVNDVPATTITEYAHIR